MANSLALVLRGSQGGGVSMRVAVVTVSRGPHVRVYVERLVESGHDVTVLTNGNDYFGLPVRAVDLRPFSGRRFRLPQSVLDSMRSRRLLRELRSGGYDVVDCQMVMLDALDVLHESEAPVVLSFHGSDLHRAGELLPRVAAELPSLLPRAAAIHAVSRFMAAELVAMGAPADRIEVFQYGIEVDRFVPMAPAPRPHRIACTRSLQPLYRTHLVIEALPEVLRSIPDATLAIYGAGPEEPRLRELCVRLDLGERVEFLGMREPVEIAREVGGAAVWASMAETDGTPLSLLEAMAAGAVPVVADLPTLREWIEPGAGVLVEPTAHAVATGLIEGMRLADSGAHVERNRTIVAERGSRAVNLARYEAMLRRAAQSR